MIAFAASQIVGIIPAIASEKPPVLLPQSSKWIVDYDDDSCILARSFGSDAQRLVARFTWFAPSDGFQLMLIGKSLPGNSTSSRVSVGFGPGANRYTTVSANGMSGDEPMVIIRNVRIDNLQRAEQNAELPPVTAAQEKAVDWLDIQIDRKRWRLALGSMGAVMTAKRACMNDLVKHWGYDPAVQDALSRPAMPIGSPGNWLRDNDYPSDALLNGASGLVRFRIDVDRDGKVGGCHILKGVRSPEFEKLTCDRVRAHARFQPALDAAGRPVASYYVNTAYWKMAGA